MHNWGMVGLRWLHCRVKLSRVCVSISLVWLLPIDFFKGLHVFAFWIQFTRDVFCCT